MTHEKKKMTRTEAVKLFAKYHVYGDPNDTVDFYIEAGMLEVSPQPPFSAFDEFIKVMKANAKNQNYFNWNDIEQLLKKNGLKIVKDTD